MLIAAQGLAPWADEVLPYTDPLGLCDVVTVTLPPAQPNPARPASCDASSFAADPRCHLNAPAVPPSAPELELRRATVAALSSPANRVATWVPGCRAHVDDLTRDGFTRDIDHPPR